eukprot:sb/3466799/
MGGRASREDQKDPPGGRHQRRTTVHRFSRVHQGTVNCLAEGPSPDTIITGGGDGNATLFDYSSGKVVRYLRHDSGKAVTAVTGSKCGRIVTGSRDTCVRLWDGTSATCFTGHTLVVTAVVLSGDRIISGSRDNCINAWDITTSKLLYSITESRNLITSLTMTGGHLLVQTSEDKRVRLWDTRNLELVHVYPVKQYIQSCCDVNTAGTLIVTGSNGFNGSGCEVSLWDIRNRMLVKEMHGHEESVNTVRFFPETTEMVVSGSKDSLLKVWDKGAEIIEKRLPGQGAITDVIAYRNKNIICSTNNGCVKLTVDDQDFVVDMLCF